MPRYELSEHMVKNVLQFLNRTPVEGFTEQDAMYELRYIFAHPLIDEEQPSQS